MIVVGDTVRWQSEAGLALRGSVVKVGPKKEGAEELTVRVADGTLAGQLVVITSDQASKENAPGPEVKKEDFSMFSNLWEQDVPMTPPTGPVEVELIRYVTQPDPRDGHVHYADLDADGDGITETATGPNNYSHTHNVVDFQVMPTTGTDGVSTHPGDPVVSEEPMPEPEVVAPPDVAPAAPVAAPAVAEPVVGESWGMWEQDEEDEEDEGKPKNGKKEESRYMWEQDEEDEEEDMPKNGNGKNGKKNGYGKNGEKKESYTQWLDRVLYEEDDEKEIKPEVEVEPDEDDEANESYWERRFDQWMAETEGSATPLKPTSEPAITDGGGDNMAVDPSTTTAVPGPETKADPVATDQPTAKKAGREIDGEQPLPAGADKKAAVESAVKSVLRGASPRDVVKNLIAETAGF